jgi:polyhydroxyalkanoate synthase
MSLRAKRSNPDDPRSQTERQVDANRDAREELAARAADGMLGPNPFVGLRPEDIWEQLQRTFRDMMQRPGLLLEAQAGLAKKLAAVLADNSTLGPSPGDRRFRDAEWHDNPFYRTCLQTYLAWAETLDDCVGKLGLGRADTERARFAVSLVVDALAPSNMLWTNPAAVKKLQETGGASLAQGLQHLLQDLASNHGMPAQVDKTAFRVGGNLAMWPGAVVFRNPALELIQYRPAGDTVFARPLLIVPPQINKFYLFDLAPGRSLVEYLARSGFQVFIVSWRNPTPAERDWNLDTYVGALLQAIDAVQAIAAMPEVNLAGACSGAMTMSALLGHLAARGDRRVGAATMMVMVLGRNEESQLGLFATPQAVAAAKAASRAEGVLRGEEMGRMFAWMRPNDLVWNYWVNNYLLGNAPPAFDVLYWNNDSTRLPAAFHAQLLDISVGNLFRTPGALAVLGTPIDLAQVSCDKYVVAGVTDHITPWQGGYRAARLFGGSTEFVLSSSGHIQSIINPPGNAKARYFVNRQSPADAAAWRAGAEAHDGSWWEDWREWLSAHSGDSRPAPAQLGDDRHPPLAAAPGTYVLEA